MVDLIVGLVDLFQMRYLKLSSDGSLLAEET